MKKIARLISVVAIAMVLMVAFNGVALASHTVPPTPETETLEITTYIISKGSGTVVENQELSLGSSSINLLDNPLFAFGKGELYGDVKHDKSVIGSGVTTDFNKNFNVIKSTGDTSKGLGLNAYSKLVVTDVRATTITKVGMTDDPLGLQYKIDAGGSKKGSMAKGRIAAGMSVFAVDGSTRLSYETESTASGLFKFHMVMEYTSKITMP